ncbi:MAG TPA: D-alanyl-D-alanine carboxypeptidase/D-alanyl-D-alanine-endopeptidase [Candidatus Elarobacter sp.]|nr:D-alanyl-D-alanine carboxypeptidase/D-alanyl-D-alanine-endopeptidase [Candidatus Elarobacter sp.]
MNRRRAALAALTLTAGALACAAPAFAVDRTGRDLPKPVATGEPWTDAQIASLDANLDLAIAGSKTLAGAHVGAYAIDPRDGRVLYERNQDDAFQPASTLKLVVGSAALDKLGPAFRFHTDATVENAVVDGVVRGNLTLHGTGDVLLDEAALATLPAALREASIDQIERDVVADPLDPLQYRPGWEIDDLPWYYAAPITALGYDDDAVAVTVTPGAQPGDPVTATVQPWGSAVRDVHACAPRELSFCIVVAATTGAAETPSSLDALRPRDRADEVDVVGTLAAGAKPEVLSLAVPSPPRFAAAAARRALLAGGVRIGDREIGVPPHDTTPSRVVWSHDSEPLSDLLADMWLPSDNLLAEALLHALGAEPPALRGTSEAGIAWEKTWLSKVGVDPAAGLDLVDGSGLSAYDRITPRDLVLVLRHDWDGPNRDLVLDALPIAGVRGTLRSQFRGTSVERHVFAKTGTLSHVATLAGYATTEKHGAVIFAFQVDDWIGDRGDLRDARERFLTQLVED